MNNISDTNSCPEVRFMLAFDLCSLHVRVIILAGVRSFHLQLRTWRTGVDKKKPSRFLFEDRVYQVTLIKIKILDKVYCLLINNILHIHIFFIHVSGRYKCCGKLISFR